eukprot:5486923-Ditylum_brightwellii.AAC.1
MGFILDKNGENVVFCPAMIGGADKRLEEIGHLQQPTKVKTDNVTANSFVHVSMHAKRSKYWDMWYNWLGEDTTQEAL